MSKIVITGASSGIGLATARALAKEGHEVRNLDIQYPEEKENFSTSIFDISDPSAYMKLGLFYCGLGVDTLINNAGVNFIDWIENTTADKWSEIININARSIFLMTKVLMEPLMKNSGTILNIVSNASHMPMTNSIAYNASKGAAHIMTLQMARELGPKGITVFGISPNRVGDTAMSDYIDSQVCGLRGWTEEYAREYQLKALPAGEETNKDTLAEFIAFILSTKQRHKYMAGTIIPYGK